MTSNFHICPVPVSSSVGVRWRGCSGAGVRDGRSDRSGEVINCIFTLLMSVFLPPLAIKATLFWGSQRTQGKRARGCLFTMWSGREDSHPADEAKWRRGWKSCRARWVLCYNTSSPVPCKLLNVHPLLYCISMSFILSTWLTLPDCMIAVSLKQSPC